MDKREAEAISEVIDMTDGEIEALKNTGLRPGGSGVRKPLLIANTNHVIVKVEASKKEHDLITTNANDLERITREKQKEKSR